MVPEIPSTYDSRYPIVFIGKKKKKQGLILEIAFSRPWGLKMAFPVK